MNLAHHSKISNIQKGQIFIMIKVQQFDCNIQFFLHLKLLSMLSVFQFDIIFVLYQMERKGNKKASVKDKDYLEILLKIYMDIQQSLYTLFKKDRRPSSLFQNIFSYPNKSGCVQREVKRLNQIKLFAQTLQAVQNLVKNQNTTTKSHLFMNFDIISKIIFDRIKEFLSIKGQQLAGIQREISMLKAQLLDWCETKQKDVNRRKTLKSSTRHSSKYYIKYVFSQMSTNNNSYCMKQNTIMPTTADKQAYNIKKSIRGQTIPQNFNQFKETQHANDDDLIKSKFHRKSHIRFHLTTTEGFNKGKNNHKRKNYGKTVSMTPNERQNLIKNLNLTPQIQSTINIEGLTEDTPFQEQNKEPIDTTQKKLRFGNSQNVSLQQINEQTEQQKKLDFYMSQNYLKSKKFIDNITLMSNKAKKRDSIKRISNVRRNSLFKEFQESQCQIESYQNVSHIFSRKNITKRKKTQFSNFRIEDDMPNKDASINGDRSKNRKTTELILARKDKDKRKTLHKSKFDSKEIRLKKELIQKTLEIEYQPERKGKELYVNQAVEDCNAEPLAACKNNLTSTHSSSFKQFYVQLNEIRSQIVKPIDQYYKDFSIFFNIQNKLAQQQNKKIQKVLQNRVCRVQPHEFDIHCHVTKRQNPYFQYQWNDRNEARSIKRQDDFKIGQKQMSTQTQIIKF